MECNVSDLVKRGHNQAAELKASCGAVDVRDVAQLISDLAAQLDVQLARSNALAAENAGLKALARGWANATDDRLFEEHGEIFHDSIDACEEELKTICPATDAFLAEVRAQGVDALVERRITAARLAKEAGHEITARDLEGEAIRARFFAMEIRKGAKS